MEVDFTQYERLFWRVLAHLAERGYFVPPDEARDLFHDFYVDAWHDLPKHFDPKKGRFSTYLFTAFYRFARRRILRWHRWHKPLRTIQNLAVRTSDRSDVISQVVEKEEQSSRLLALGAALNSLPRLQRAVLQDFLIRRGNERELALPHGITRYRLRETLIDALGQVVTSVGEEILPDTVTGKVALALWRDGRTVRDSSRLLGLTTAEVQVARQRFVEGVLEQLRAGSSTSICEGDNVNPGPQQLLKNTLLSIGTESLLREVQERATEIRKALETADVDLSEEESDVLGTEPEWVAKVYGALAGPEKSAEEENGIARAIRELTAQTETEIAQAFVLAIENLPPHFRDWESWFSNVPPDDMARPYQEYLRGLAVVREAMPHAEGLLRYGLTPTVFVEGARGLELLGNRLIRNALYSQDVTEELANVYSWIRSQKEAEQVVTMDLVLHCSSSFSSSVPRVPYSILVAQMRATPQCPPEAAEPLLSWLVQVAQLRPFLIRGYETLPLDKYATRMAQQTITEEIDLVGRWSRTPQEVRSEERELVSA